MLYLQCSMLTKYTRVRTAVYPFLCAAKGAPESRN